MHHAGNTPLLGHAGQPDEMDGRTQFLFFAAFFPFTIALPGLALLCGHHTTCPEQLHPTCWQVPGLAVVIVGERKDSQTYVRMKRKACEEVIRLWPPSPCLLSSVAVCVFTG